MNIGSELALHAVLAMACADGYPRRSREKSNFWTFTSGRRIEIPFRFVCATTVISCRALRISNRLAHEDSSRFTKIARSYRHILYTINYKYAAARLTSTTIPPAYTTRSHLLALLPIELTLPKKIQYWDV